MLELLALFKRAYKIGNTYQPEFWIREKKKRRYLLMENCETVWLGI